VRKKWIVPHVSKKLMHFGEEGSGEVLGQAGCIRHSAWFKMPRR